MGNFTLYPIPASVLGFSTPKARSFAFRRVEEVDFCNQFEVMEEVKFCDQVEVMEEIKFCDQFEVMEEVKFCDQVEVMEIKFCDQVNAMEEIKFCDQDDDAMEEINSMKETMHDGSTAGERMHYVGFSSAERKKLEIPGLRKHMCVPSRLRWVCSQEE